MNLINILLNIELVTFTLVSLGIIITCSLILDIAKILSDYPVGAVSRKNKHKEHY